MKLSFEQIKNITVGALHIWEEGGAIRFARCTQKQIDAWNKLDEILGYRATATTGIRLDFHTNSKTFSFVSKAICNYEIYIDNVLTYAYFSKDFENEKRKEISLDGKEHRITLYFPSHDEPGALEAVEIEDGASIEPHKFDCKIYFIGDSITQGWESTWVSLSYAYHVSRFYNAESVIQGVGGAYYHSTIFDEAIEFEPDIVIAAFGTNDWVHGYTTIEDGKKECGKFLDKLVSRYGSKKLFGISPIWRADADQVMPMGTFEECVSYVKEEIVNHGMTLIDGQLLTPHISDFYSDEYLHPDTKGFGIYSLNLIAEMQKNM